MRSGGAWGKNKRKSESVGGEGGVNLETLGCGDRCTPCRACVHAVTHCGTTLPHVRPCRAALRHDPAARASMPRRIAARPCRTRVHAVTHCSTTLPHVRPCLDTAVPKLAAS